MPNELDSTVPAPASALAPSPAPAPARPPLPGPLSAEPWVTINPQGFLDSLSAAHGRTITAAELDRLARLPDGRTPPSVLDAEGAEPSRRGPENTPLTL